MPNQRRRILKGAALALPMLLAGCGFRLAGERPLPPALKSVFVEVVNPYTVTAPPLLSAVQARITRSGGEVKSDPEQAETALRLSNLEEARQVLSIGTDGRAIEYRLLTRVTYQLTQRGGVTLVPPDTQTVSRDFSFSATQILPKEAEEARLRNYIQDELADLVLLRIESELRKAPPPAQ